MALPLLETFMHNEELVSLQAQADLSLDNILKLYAKLIMEKLYGSPCNIYMGSMVVVAYSCKPSHLFVIFLIVVILIILYCSLIM